MFLNAVKIFRANYIFFYTGILLVFVAVFPHSRFLLSMSEFGLFAFWLAEGNFKKKINILKTHPEVLLFSSIFFLHIAGLLNTQNFSYALNDLKIKLPVFLFPIVIATSPKLSSKNIKLILLVFTLSVVLKTLYGLAGIYGLTGEYITDYQKLAGKFSHIRYALLLNIAAFSMLYYSVLSPEREKPIYKILYFSAFAWLSIFILILHSVTGWVIYLVLLFYSFFSFMLKQKNKNLKVIFISLFLLLFFYISYFLYYSVNRFYKSDKIIPENTEQLTEEGNKYVNDFSSKERENGHFVYIYICEKELKDEWNKRSNFDYDGRDRKNQLIKFTLIRYLTSKNLRKDRDGVRKLSEQDIKNIESGMTNYIFEKKYSVYSKIYELLWQYEKYSSGGNPENQSLSQRFEFLKAGKEIIKRNFWFGTGTGDVKDEFQNQYEISKSVLSEKHRLRAHNQYITFFIAFGFFGFLWFLAAYVYPVIKTKKYNSFLFMVSFITISLSMFNEDTLETQMGATLFAFFLSFFLFGTGNLKK